VRRRKSWRDAVRKGGVVKLSEVAQLKKWLGALKKEIGVPKKMARRKWKINSKARLKTNWGGAVKERRGAA